LAVQTGPGLVARGRVRGRQGDLTIQNAFVEPFKGRLRDECLNEYVFSNLHEAPSIIETSGGDYNATRYTISHHLNLQFNVWIEPAPIADWSRCHT
jgi:hypothetical protein